VARARDRPTDLPACCLYETQRSLKPGASNSRSELNALSPELLGQCACCCKREIQRSISLRSRRCTAPVQHSLCIPTIDDRLASEGNRGQDLNSRRTISHSRFDGFVPILEQSCWCQTPAAGNSWRRCLKLNGPNQISDVPIEFLIYRKHRVAQIMIAASSSHFCAGQGEHDCFGQLPQTKWLPE
jgi:hypothetical protein